MEPRVLHLDVAGLKGCILHLRRERMRYRIAEHAEPDGRIDVAKLLPILEISECVCFVGARLFHVIPNVVRDLA